MKKDYDLFIKAVWEILFVKPGKLEKEPLLLSGKGFP